MFQEFKDILGYEGHYQVSNLGAVKSLKRAKERILTSVLDSDGYFNVNLIINGKTEHKKVHRLVAEAFIPNPDNLPLVRHLDDNTANNLVSNLKWGTHQDNMDDRNNKNRQARGEKNGISILTQKQVIQIKKELENWKRGDSVKLANQYNVARQTISSIKKGLTWTHI